MGEIHELFVLTLSLVWFAGATPDKVCKRVLHEKWCNVFFQTSFGPVLVRRFLGWVFLRCGPRFLALVTRRK